MTRLMAVEFFKLRKRMMTWILAMLMVGLVILLYSVLWSVSGHATTFGENAEFTGQDLRRALFLQTSVPFSLQVVASFGTVFAMILAAGAVGSEYSWGTVRLMATAASGRVRLIAAKLLVVCGLVTAGALLAVAVGLIYSSIITVTNGGSSFSFVTPGFIGDQAESFGRTLFVMMPYVTLAFAIAAIGRSTLAGVGAGIGIAFVEPIIGGLMRLAGNPWKEIPNYLINANSSVILLQNKLPDVVRFGPRARDLAQTRVNGTPEAMFILAIYSVAFVALALLVYRRRDITA
jgi:ABC-type transport system involved in multi-copper enzyme maturation permease subunit